MTNLAAQARIREKLDAIGDLKSTAVADFLDEFDAGMFVESTVDEWIKQARADKPQRFHDAGTDDLARSAFVDGNLTARGKLHKQMSMAECDALAQTFGLKNFHDFGRGKVPTNTDADPNKKKSGGDNPWKAGNWNVTKQAQLVKSLGTKRAAGIAAAAGCRIGSTKPNPAYS
jgi:hypothetical protein